MVETDNKEAGAGVPEDTKTMEVDPEVSNKDFQEGKDEDGKVHFSCTHCQYKNQDAANTKRHITSCHVKPKTAKRSTADVVDQDVKRKKDKKSVPDDKTEEGDGNVFPPTQEDDDLMFKELESLIASTKKNETEDSIVLHSTVVETEDAEVEEKNKVIQNLQATINMLEEERKKELIQIGKFRVMFDNLKETIKTQEKEKKDLQGKVKEGKGTDNAKLKKDLAKAEKRKEELIKEVEDIKAEKAVIEVELKSANERIKYFEEVLDKGQDEHGKEKCLNYERGFCSYSRCKYLHPSKECNEFRATRRCNKSNCQELHRNPNKSPSKQKQQDCKFWLEGHCKFGDSCHRGAHEQEKLNTKTNEIKEMRMMVQQIMQHQAQQMMPQQQPRQMLQPPQIVQQQQQLTPTQMIQKQQNEMKEMMIQMQKQLQPQQRVQQQQPTQVAQQPQQMVQQHPGQMVQQQQQPDWPLLQQPGGNSQVAGFGALQQQPPLQQSAPQQPVPQQPVLQQPVLQRPVLQQPGLQQPDLQQQQAWYNGQQGEAMDQGWSVGQLHH